MTWCLISLVEVAQRERPLRATDGVSCSSMTIQKPSILLLRGWHDSIRSVLDLLPRLQVKRPYSNGIRRAQMPTWDDFVEWTLQQSAEAGGRKALRRRWATLRALADQVSKNVAEAEIESLLGKRYDQL